jgi:transcriptional regulator with AAA-type ATPase domain
MCQQNFVCALSVCQQAVLLAATHLCAYATCNALPHAALSSLHCRCLQVPPLRVRPADILDLERYYMRLVSKEQGVKLTLTQEAERALLAYSFPENITVSTGPATCPALKLVRGGKGV